MPDVSPDAVTTLVAHGETGKDLPSSTRAMRVPFLASICPKRFTEPFDR